MKKILIKAYWVFLVIFVVLLMHIFSNFNVDMKATGKSIGYTTVTYYDVTTIEDSEAPEGIRQIITLTLDQKETLLDYLIFYSSHQEINVYMEEELVYSLAVDEDNAYGRTPGSVWNMIPLDAEDAGKKVRIDLIPVYDSFIDSFPTFYIGERFGIISSVMMRNLPAFFLSTLAIFSGFFYIGFMLYSYKKGNVDNSLVMLGVFAILIGLWKLSDMEIFSFLVGGNLIATYLPYFTLLLACVPYNVFIRNQYSTKEHWIWDVANVVCCACIMIEIALQFLHIADFRESLGLTHIAIFITVSIILAMMVYEMKKCGFDSRLKKHTICICGCIIGLVIDMFIFYVTKSQGTLLWGILGFMVYIIVLGLTSMQEIRKLIAIGQEAKKYEQMAYHDKLTGLFNRTAYADYIGKDEFVPDHMIVAMFDLNNLKKCNDEYGHDQGDVYITTCAKLIAGAFSDIGNCYRLGGDEFCVLMKGISLDLCRKRMDSLHKELKTENEKHRIVMDMQIASGYTVYDKLLDYSIQDTVRRADKLMYKEKYSMKNQERNGAS